MLKAILVLVALTAGLVGVLPHAGTTTAGVTSDVTLSLDCDSNTAGIQSACTGLPGALLDVDVVMTNSGLDPVQLGAFRHIVLNPDVSRLLARMTDGVDLPPCDPSSLNCNPDFNQATVTGTGWACGPPVPEPDVAATTEPGQDSFLQCFNGTADGPTVPSGASLVLSKIHYRVPVSAPGGALPLAIFEGELYNEAFSELGTCNPTIGLPMTCTGATITLPLVSMSIDCNVMLPGVQSNCMVSNMAATRDVNLLIKNNGPTAFQLGAFGLKLLNPDITRLMGRLSDGNDLPACDSGSLLNCNPDFNQAAVTGEGWACGPPGSFPDDPATQEPGEDALLACFNGNQDGPNVNAGASMHVGTMRYRIVAGADPGPITLTLFQGSVYDESFGEQGSCAPVDEISMPCNDATLTFYCPIDMADVNNDGRVNIADLGITAVHNGELPAPAQYDQNFDGVINVADRGIIGSLFFKSVSQCP